MKATEGRAGLVRPKIGNSYKASRSVCTEMLHVNNAKDVMASDTSIIDLNDKIDDVVLTEDKIAESLIGLHQKVDTLIEPDETEDKIAESLLGLHQKVDTLVAADDTELGGAEFFFVVV